MFRLICYVQQLRLIHGGGESTDDSRIWWHVAAAWCLCCPQTHYNGGCYFRLTARLHVLTAADSRTSRNKRGTETDYYAVKFYALYSVFLMRNHYHRGRLGPGLWHAISDAVLSVIWVIYVLSEIMRVCFANGHREKNLQWNWTKSNFFFSLNPDPSRRNSVQMDSVSRSMGPQ